MAHIHIHAGGGCEAVIREDGNELYTWDVHQYLCGSEAVHSVAFTGGFVKKACDEHASKWKERWGDGVSVHPL